MPIDKRIISDYSHDKPPVGGGTILDVLQSDASGLFHVADVGGPGAYVVFGDTTFSHNKCAVFVDDTGPSVAMCCPNGTVSVGDVYSYGNNSLLTVDDANQKITSNVKIEVTGNITVMTNGQGLHQQSPNGHYWRLDISNAGAASWTDIGTSPP